MAELDEHAARELRLWIDNTEGYARHVEVCNANAARRWVRGTFEREPGIRLYLYPVREAARAYMREFGAFAQPVAEVFSRSTLEAVATSYVDDFLSIARTPAIWDDLGDAAARVLRKGLACISCERPLTPADPAVTTLGPRCAACWTGTGR